MNELGSNASTYTKLQNYGKRTRRDIDYVTATLFFLLAITRGFPFLNFITTFT